MDSVVENNFSKAFAIAWNENQGNYSETLAKKTINFIKGQNLKVETALDICCGSANFLKELKNNGIKCTGTEILDSYIDYDTAKYPDIEFVKTSDVADIENLGTYDLISCNHDVVNMIPTLLDWGIFFKNVYKHLNNGGIFIFDFYTKRKLQYWNEVIYDESEKLDYVKSISSDGESKASISNIYYINITRDTSDRNVNAMDREYNLNNYERKYKKTDDTTVEYFFENDEILDKIKQAGYRYLITTDANLSPVINISDMNRMHIIAIKREVNK